MTRPALLNNVDHHDLHVLPDRGAAFGDAVMHVPTFPAEFRNLQAHYPIVFQQTENGAFQPVALLGLQEAQNLFLGPAGWDAGYVPLAIEREPFLIGREGDELMIHVDLDSPRLSRSEGQPLFLPHGGSTEFLERMSSVLLALHEGLQATPAFSAALQELGLLESFVLDVEQPDGAQHRLAGFHTVHEERLAALQGPALHALHRQGHLEALYMAVASLSNFRSLIDRHQRQAGRGS